MNFPPRIEFFRAYIECALWSSIDSDGEPLDRNYLTHHFSPEAEHRSSSDCVAFLDQNQADIEMALEFEPISQLGHSFWLSRNGHGAGFFDFSHRHGPVFDRLQEAASKWPELHLYPGDDGLLYFL